MKCGGYCCPSVPAHPSKSAICYGIGVGGCKPHFYFHIRLCQSRELERLRSWSEKKRTGSFLLASCPLEPPPKHGFSSQKQFLPEVGGATGGGQCFQWLENQLHGTPIPLGEPAPAGGIALLPDLHPSPTRSLLPAQTQQCQRRRLLPLRCFCCSGYSSSWV